MASVDVVIPNYNYGRYLRECVKSVQSQGIDDLRILIVDNASTDDSVEVAKELMARDPRIKLIAREKNLGYHASINAGVDWASSHYLVALCSDDLLAPMTLRRALKFLEANRDVSFVFGRFITFEDGIPPSVPAEDDDENANWRLWDGREFIETSCTSLILASTPVVRTSAQKQAGHYRPELPYTDDLEMLLRLACFGRVGQTSAIMAMQRIHGTNISHQTWSDPIRGLADEKAMFDSFFTNEGRTLPHAKGMHRLAKRTIGKKAYRLALMHLIQGPRKTTLDLVKYIYTLCPDLLFFPPVRYLFDYVIRRDRPYARIRRFLFGEKSRAQ